MQLGGSSSPTASPTPPLLICVCLPTAWKGQEGSPSFVKCRTTTTNPPKVRRPALHNTPVTVLHCPTACSSLLTSTCPLRLLPLPTLTVRANLQHKCHMKPLKSCRTPCLAPHNAERRGQARCPTASHAGSPSSPGSSWSNSAQCWKQDRAPSTSLATGKQDSPCGLIQLPEWATAANAVHTQVPLLGSSTALPQGHQPSQNEPGLPALARPLCLKQEAGDKHKQRLNLWALSKPRLSPAGAVPSESKVGEPGYIHLQLQALYWSSWPEVSKTKWVQRGISAQHPASSKRCWEQQGRPCHMANPLCNFRLVGSCGFGCGQSGQQLPAAGLGLWKRLWEPWLQSEANRHLNEKK